MMPVAFFLSKLFRYRNLAKNYFAIKFVYGVIFILLGRPAAAAPQLGILDDFDTFESWEVKEWGEMPELSNAPPSSTVKKALRVRFEQTPGQLHPRGMVLRRSLLGSAADYQRFVLDIFVDAKTPIELQASIDADQTYDRSPLILRPGWNKDVELQLLDGLFQAKEADGTLTALQPDLAIGSLILSFRRKANEPGSIYIGEVRSHHRPEWSFKQTQTHTQNLVSRKPVRIKSLTGALTHLPIYKTMELTMELDGSVFDPFDPEEIEIKAIFTNPQGQKVEVMGFLYAGDVSIDKPVRGGIWKIRFTPSQVGTWRFVVEVKNRWSRDQSDSKKLHVTSSEGDGFVRIDSRRSNYFSLDSGRYYYPIGQNVSWLPFHDYVRYFAKMAENNENWARIWMTHWSFGIEWKPMGDFQGLGNYNLVRAQKLDQLLQEAERKRIYLQLVFDFHGSLSKKVNPEWLNNPFNEINGGFLKRPEDFFTDPKAKAIYKKRLRYIISRWGHSPYVMAWEFFNEVGFTDGFKQESVTSWHQEMSSFVKGYDPYKHLTTTSYGGEALGEAFKLSTVDFTQDHVYTNDIYNQLNDVNAKFQQFQKPFFVGEFGSHTNNGVDDADKRGVFVHAGIWIQFMQPSGGNAMPWWWDTHIELHNLFYHFGALARFAEGLDRRRHSLVPVREKLNIPIGKEHYDFELIGLRTVDYGMFWVCDSLGMSAKNRLQPLNFHHVKFDLGGFSKGAYEIEFWDTYHGKVIKKVNVLAQRNQLSLALPAFSNDLAFKIRARPNSIGP